MKKKNTADIVISAIRYIPPVISICFVVAFLFFFRDFSYEDIVSFTPDNILLSILVIFAMFAVKSLSIVVPLTIMFVASGVMYPLWLAIPINLAGLTIALTIPYFIGRLSGTELIEKLVEKYPKAKQIREIGQKNDIFISFFARAIAVTPCDVVSMLLGASGIRYPQFLLGSHLGLLPGLILQTLIGASLDGKITAPMIILFIVMMIACGIVSYTANKKQKKTAK